MKIHHALLRVLTVAISACGAVWAASALLRGAWIFAILIHTASALMIWVGFSPRDFPLHDRRRFLAHAAALSFFVLPMIGWCIALLLLSGAGIPALAQGVDDMVDMPDTTSPIDRRKNSVTARTQTHLVQSLEVMPFAEILAGEDIALKRGAIERLARQRTPNAISLLIKHRRDPSAEVRFFVNAAIERIKHAYVEELDAARFAVQQGTYKDSARLFLARVYLECARSTLFDIATTASYRQDAAFHLEQLRTSAYVGNAACWELYRFYRDAQLWHRALEAIADIDHVDGVAPRIIQQARIELEFIMGRYEQMRQRMRTFSNDHAMHDDAQWGPLLRWWGVVA